MPTTTTKHYLIVKDVAHYNDQGEYIPRRFEVNVFFDEIRFKKNNPTNLSKNAWILDRLQKKIDKYLDKDCIMKLEVFEINTTIKTESIFDFAKEIKPGVISDKIGFGDYYYKKESQKKV